MRASGVCFVVSLLGVHLRGVCRARRPTVWGVEVISQYLRRMRTPGPKAAAAQIYCGPPLSWPAVVAGALWVSGPQDRGGSRTGDFPAAQEAASAGRGAPGASAVAVSSGLHKAGPSGTE